MAFLRTAEAVSGTFGVTVTTAGVRSAEEIERTADRFPRGISEALKLRAIVRTSLQSDLIRAAQFAIGEELRTEFQAPHELPSELRTRMEEVAVRHG
jgi:hypothetical protein